MDFLCPFLDNYEFGYKLRLSTYGVKVRNYGRVICITSVLKDEGLEDLFERMLVQHNENIAGADQ